jgi:hypothetical protein
MVKYKLDEKTKMMVEIDLDEMYRSYGYPK